jgi:hypothetical protein
LPLQKLGIRVSARFNCFFRIGLSGRVQWMQLQTYKYHKIWRTSWTDEWLPFGQGRLYCINQWNHANVCRVGIAQSPRQMPIVKQPGFNSQDRLGLFCTEPHPDWLSDICLLSNTFSKLIPWEKCDQYKDHLPLSTSRLCEALYFHVHYMLPLNNVSEMWQLYLSPDCVFVCVCFSCMCMSVNVLTCASVNIQSMHTLLLLLLLLFIFCSLFALTLIWICNLTYQETLITFHLLLSHLMI